MIKMVKTNLNYRGYDLTLTKENSNWRVDIHSDPVYSSEIQPSKARAIIWAYTIIDLLHDKTLKK